MQRNRFRVLLPVTQCVMAALFGGVGLWQRSAILSRPFLEGQTLWDTTARFHVWPWPYKFAAVVNMPAFLAGLLLSGPIGNRWVGLPEVALLAPSLLFVALLWYWVGAVLDRQCDAGNGRSLIKPWVRLLVFTLICAGGALIPGSGGYLVFGVLVWGLFVLGLFFGQTRSRERNFTTG